MSGVFYKPQNAFMGDIIPFYDDGRFKPFYLKKWRDAEGNIHREGWHMLTSSDNIHFTEHCCHIPGATGSVIKVGELYHMFFTRFEKQYDPVKQWIHHAVSYDHMQTWTEYPQERFEADNVHYEITDMRDPFVFWNEDERRYWMLVSAQDKRVPTKRKGCVGLLKSDDLKHWEFCDPFYSPQTNTSALECADLFRIGEWYYLVYSSYTDRFQTVYRMSRSLNGPWLAPEVDTFDSRAFYAAKTCSDGKGRYIYGWNATRQDDMWQFNPEHDRGDDYKTWDWGGNMIVHKITQQTDGTLCVSPIDTLAPCFPHEQSVSVTPLTGDWHTTAAGWQIDTPHGFSSAILSPVPYLCRLEADICFPDTLRQFGIALQVTRDFDLGYYLIFEPYRQRVQFKSGIRLYEDGGKMFPYEVEMERPLHMVPHQTIHVELYIQGSILVVYFDNKVALSTRMFNYADRQFGLFASDGTVQFENIRLYLSDPNKADKKEKK